MPRTFPSFEAFWPWYLAQHRRRRNRILHYVGGIGAIVLVGASVVGCGRRPALAAPFFAYACAWLGHALEPNRPATWDWPLWSLRGEMRMLRLALLRRRTNVPPGGEAR